MNRKLSGLVRLFRPELPFAAGVCVLLGEIVALGALPSLRQALLGFACAFFISGSALVSNDVFDLEVDRVNAPGRPLPSGAVSAAEALLLAGVALLVGLAAALALSAAALALALVFGAVGLLYNWKFKQAGLAGNLMVAASVGITFILGGLAAGRPFDGVVWAFSLVAFLIDLGEEIAGDAMDMEGDRKRGSRSLAIRMGRTPAVRISAALFGLVIAISLVLIPVLPGRLGTGYLPMIAIMDLMIAYFTRELLLSRTPEAGRRAMRWIYLGGLFGMLAFLVGQLWAR